MTPCAMGSCPLNVVNCVLVNNRASQGGGGIAVVDGAELVNVTATGNGPGGGVQMRSGIIRNTILWGNRGASPRDLRVNMNVDLDHSDVGDESGPITDLGGNISTNPLFVAAPANIHLSPGSPAIDSGTCTGAPTTDFDGDPRPTGAGCDMGADEFVP